MAKRGRPPKKKEENEEGVTGPHGGPGDKGSDGDASPASEVKTWEERKAEKKAEEEEAKKNIPTDCRLCAHYPLQNVAATTSLSPELTAVTQGFTRTFCGQAPAGGLDCRDKKFTPIAK